MPTDAHTQKKRAGISPGQPRRSLGHRRRAPNGTAISTHSTRWDCTRR